MDTRDEHLDILVVGGGQAGLTVGHGLARSGRRFAILDAHARVGDAWRKRWDSLKLFTPARFNGLPGLPFPAGRGDVVAKDQMADYLERYAAHHDLPVRNRAQVKRLRREDGVFIADTSAGRFTADQVIVAMGNYQVPHRPPFAEELDPGTFQLHSKHYRNPGQLRPGSVLVVGGGNSAADIALELSKSHRVTMSGKEFGHVPFRIEPWIARHFLISLVRFVGHFVLSLRTPIGRRVRPKMLHTAGPLVRVKPGDLLAAGVERVPRVAGVRGGKPVLQDGRVLDVDNVVWCTGYRSGFDWIEMPILDDHQLPAHERGVVPSVPGLYFVGLHFQYAATSDTVTGVARDARYVVKHALGSAMRGRATVRRPAPGVAKVA